MATLSPFIPAVPTLWPSMLGARERPLRLHPFDADTVRYVYFARNAVWLAVKALQLEGAEVLVPAYHHGVEVEALCAAGASVRFYRVGAHFDVDVEEVERRIGPHTRALYLIHYVGFPGPVAALRALADRRGLALIEDCALSLLSCDGSVPLGTTGDVSLFSLYKTLPLPHGGAVTFPGRPTWRFPDLVPPGAASTWSHVAGSLLANLELRTGGFGRELRRGLRAMGRRGVRAAGVERVGTGTAHFESRHVDLGMAPVVQRILAAQDLAGVVERRRRNWFHLLGAMRSVSRPLFHQLPPGVCPLFYPLWVEDKRAVQERLAAHNVEAIDFWRHFHPACDARQFPEAAALREHVLELPVHQDLTPAHIAALGRAAIDALQAESRPTSVRARG